MNFSLICQIIEVGLLDLIAARDLGVLVVTVACAGAEARLVAQGGVLHLLERLRGEVDSDRLGDAGDGELHPLTLNNFVKIHHDFSRVIRGTIFAGPWGRSIRFIYRFIMTTCVS